MYSFIRTVNSNYCQATIPVVGKTPDGAKPPIVTHEIFRKICWNSHFSIDRVNIICCSLNKMSMYGQLRYVASERYGIEAEAMDSGGKA